MASCSTVRSTALHPGRGVDASHGGCALYRRHGGDAQADFAAQADPNADSAGLEERYGADAFGRAVNVRNSMVSRKLTEMDALIALTSRCLARWSTSRPSSPTTAAEGGRMETYTFLRHMADSFGLLACS